METPLRESNDMELFLNLPWNSLSCLRNPINLTRLGYWIVTVSAPRAVSMEPTCITLVQKALKAIEERTRSLHKYARLGLWNSEEENDDFTVGSQDVREGNSIFCVLWWLSTGKANQRVSSARFRAGGQSFGDPRGREIQEGRGKHSIPIDARETAVHISQEIGTSQSPWTSQEA